MERGQGRSGLFGVRRFFTPGRPFAVRVSSDRKLTQFTIPDRRVLLSKITFKQQDRQHASGGTSESTFSTMLREGNRMLERVTSSVASATDYWFRGTEEGDENQVDRELKKNELEQLCKIEEEEEGEEEEEEEEVVDIDRIVKEFKKAQQEREERRREEEYVERIVKQFKKARLESIGRSTDEEDDDYEEEDIDRVVEEFKKGQLEKQEQIKEEKATVRVPVFEEFKKVQLNVSKKK